MSGLEVAGLMQRPRCRGLMRELDREPAADQELRATYERAHLDYLARRDAAAVGAVMPPPPRAPR